MLKRWLLLGICLSFVGCKKVAKKVEEATQENHDKPKKKGSPETTAKKPEINEPTPTPKKPGKHPPTIHLELGLPVDNTPEDDILLVKPQYVISYNPKRNSPNFAAWNLNASYFGKAPRFKGQFIQDPAVPETFYRVRHDDYTNSGYDRGHLVRSEERTRDDEDNKSTFFTTNIVPQYHDLNAGPWLRFEEYCQKLSQKERKELYLVAGGIYSAKPSTIGKGVAVPEATYKIVVVLDQGQKVQHVNEKTRVIAIKMPNRKGIISEDWRPYRVSVAQLEKETGYDFLPDVKPEVQRAIEPKVDAEDN